MKRISLLVLMLFVSNVCYAQFYVVVNKNGSIHTIAEKSDDVLVKGQKRYVIDEKPDHFKNDFYYWGSEGLTKKPNEEVEEIKNARDEKARKIEIKRAYKELKAIEEIEAIDGGDWSEEKAKWQSILNDKKK